MSNVSREEFEAVIADLHSRLDALQADQSPLRYVNAVRRRLTGPAPASPPPTRSAEESAAPKVTGPAAGYADLYEKHAQTLPPETSIGDGDFDRIGQIELSILIDAGLKPSSYLVDFGCGTGRLAVVAVPYLSEGRYLGTDISPTMLQHADALLQTAPGGRPPYASFVLQQGEHFPTETPPDMICAYSVFTHMEHEDTYRYLRAARTASGPDTVFVASCLPMDLTAAQNIFEASAQKGLADRWDGVRNVVTSRELFETVAGMAGWSVVAWHPGDQPATTLPDGTMAALGQSVVVLQPHATTG